MKGTILRLLHREDYVKCFQVLCILLTEWKTIRWSDIKKKKVWVHMFASLTNLSISSLTELLVKIFPPVHTGCKKIHSGLHWHLSGIWGQQAKQRHPDSALAGQLFWKDSKGFPSRTHLDLPRMQETSWPHVRTTCYFSVWMSSSSTLCPF